MKDDSQKDIAADRETILMALDQISQTIEVMNSVVDRLRSYVEAQEVTREDEPHATIRHDRILH
mgnify:CR=1 FL=1